METAGTDGRSGKRENGTLGLGGICDAEMGGMAGMAGAAEGIGESTTTGRDATASRMFCTSFSSCSSLLHNIN